MIATLTQILKTIGELEVMFAAAETLERKLELRLAIGKLLDAADLIRGK